MERKSANSQPTLRHKLVQDALASVVVFLVALPLCMGIAIASGVPIDKAAPLGLMTGIVGGLIVGSLSGCRLQVTGPAAGLAVIVAQLIQQHGFQTLGVIIFWAGVIQLLAGVCRLGQVFRAVAPAVIQGMLAGIGVLIFASQFHVMVDDSPPGTGKEFGGVINLVTIPQAIWKGVIPQDGTTHHWAALIGVITIGAIVLWGLFSPRKLKLVPAPLIGVLVAMGVAAVLRACEKRPISIDTIEEFVSSLERELQEAGDLEIDSKEIGERVIRKLYDVDEVAYVRFASVYRSFKDVNQFMDELKELLKGKEGPEAGVSLHEPSGGDNEAEEEKSIRYIGPGRRRGDLADVD